MWFPRPKDYQLSDVDVFNSLYEKNRHGDIVPKCAERAPNHWIDGRIDLEYGIINTHPTGDFYQQAKLTIDNGSDNSDLYLIVGLDNYHMTRSATERYYPKEYRDYIFNGRLSINPDLFELVVKDQSIFDYYCNPKELNFLRSIANRKDFTGFILMEPVDFPKYFRINTRIF